MFRIHIAQTCTVCEFAGQTTDLFDLYAYTRTGLTTKSSITTPGEKEKVQCVEKTRKDQW